MNLDGSPICTPAIAYVVISIVLMCVISCLVMYKQGFVNGAMSSSFGSCFQLSSICCVTIVLALLCNISPVISWIIVAVWVCCMCSGLIGTMYSMIKS